MSVSARIVYVLTLPKPRFMERAHHLLEDYRRDYSALDCFITNLKGDILASASVTPSKKTSGATCADMPYFKEAVSGNIGHYFARGPTNEERIYYVSAPIKRSKYGIIGVVVIKKNIAVKPILQHRLVGIIITFFMCALAIGFFVMLKKRERLIAVVEEANKQLQVLDTMKSEFISIVSHDLRTPLTAIKNAVSILRKDWPGWGPLDDKQKELLDIILNNTNRQVRMIADLLDISKIEMGVMNVRPENVDIVNLSGDTVKSLRPLAEEKTVTMEAVFDNKPLIAYADPDHIRRVLSNLLHNAIKFTPSGGKITLSMNIINNEAMVTVSDTGPGIPPDVMNKLFSKFYRSWAAAQHKEGSGLGLAISKGLVEAQGGRIWVESEMCKGTSLHFTLPLESQDKTKTLTFKK